ncbi:hypothetical protein ATJ97_2592 [Georgenia soli]|uniref:Leucine rich repeat variant domain-containing protein n=1 Tax=Georgenia soli TaxID=638953 RepID=A0A2A9EP76_9MICO|nr:hypothetical protein [Georgenia soli]PFG40072.1 hypothetical protein ATJ97_2592 [Georgenia soli]
MAAADQYSSYDASHPSTRPEVLAEIAQHRPELRALVAANPSTPEPTAQWLAGLGDVAVDAALRRRAGASSPWQQPDAGPQAAYGQQPGLDAQPGAHESAGHSQPGAYGQPAGHSQAGTYGEPAGYGQPTGFVQPGPNGQPAGYGPAYGASYGQPGHQGAQPPYGYQNPQAGPWTTAQPRSSSAVKWIVGGAVLVIVAVVAVVIGLISSGFGGFETSGPDGYGEDAALDALWDKCEAGNAQACDDLFLESPFGSEYEEFGGSCGGRFPGTDQYCTDLM